MKTSIYFVFWIVIYPILGLFHNPVIAQNSFIVALVLAFGLSWLLNRLMPNTFAYERKLQISPILSDVYEGKVDSFKKRIRRNNWRQFLGRSYICRRLIALCFLSPLFRNL